jgi:signal transduction histidine kinase
MAATQRSVLDEIDTLQRLVDDLLILAEGDAQGHLPPSGLVDLGVLANEEARLLRAGGDVVVDTAGVQTARARGDAGQLGRALRNLGENAARHARSRITLATQQRDGIVTLTVSDDGPGIPAVDRTRIFERFARLDDSRHLSTGGFGLGLAIAADTVRRHGGTIRVDDTEAGGASFVITLPAAER